MEELYFTIAGCSHYFGSDFMEWFYVRDRFKFCVNVKN